MKKRGNRLGFRFFETVLKTSGLRSAYSFLYIVCLHYLLFDPSARRAADAYLRRRFPTLGSLRRLGMTYRLFISQGKNLIDRYAHTVNASLFTIQTAGFDTLEKLDPETGFVLLTAHVGNWQIALTSLRKMNRTVYLLMRPEDNPAVQQSLRIQEENDRIRILSVDGPMGGMVEAMQALGRGDVVAIMGDRPYGARSVPVRFLGDRARFPCAAFLLAAGARCPVVTLLSSKTGTHTYQVDIADCFTPQWTPGEAKEKQIEPWAQRFAGVLQTFLDKHPLECFLFHDIWETPS